MNQVLCLMSSFSRLDSDPPPVAVIKRLVDSEARRTVSGRVRWSSYELVGAAALSMAAKVDDEVPGSIEVPVQNGLAACRTRSGSTGSPHPVADLNTSPDPARLTPNNLSPKERRTNHDEILGNTFNTFISIIILNIIQANCCFCLLYTSPSPRD